MFVQISAIYLCRQHPSTLTEKQKNQQEGDDVDLDISAGGTATTEILKKNHFVNFLKLEMYLDCNTDPMPSLQNFPIWCCSRLKNIPAEKCELESFAIRS